MLGTCYKNFIVVCISFSEDMDLKYGLRGREKEREFKRVKRWWDINFENLLLILVI